MKKYFVQSVLALSSLVISVAVIASPKIESWVSSKGAKVLYVQAKALPMLDVRVVFDAGSARDGGSPGLAAFTNNMLTQGAGEWNADALAERLEDRGIRLGAGAARDMAWLSIRTLSDTETRDVAVDTLAAMIAKPSFDKADFTRVGQQMQIGLRRALQSPAKVASRRFYSTLYAGHPYAHPTGGTEESLKAITLEKMHSFHRMRYVAANAVISIVGDIDRKAAESLVEKLTADMIHGVHAEALPDVPEVRGGELRQTFPSSQTHIYVGQSGVSRHDPDYFPLYVGNHILGGGALVSILGEEVRNKRGLSYSVYSYFLPMRTNGPFLMVAQTKNKKAAEALAVMQDTLKEFVEKGPSDELLLASKRNIMGGFPLKVASNKKIVEYISMMGFYDLPLDWLDTLVAKVDAVTIAQVKDAFKRRVDPAKGIAVVVGGK